MTSASATSSDSRPDDQTSTDWWAWSGPLGLLLATLAVLALVLLAAATGLSPSPAVWYVTRAAGMTTYLLLWLSVVSGLAMSLRLKVGPVDQPLLMAIHRLATELSLAFVALHLLSVAVDPTVSVGMLGVLFPFMSDVRQPWTDLGIISAYLLVGIAASFGVRGLIGTQTWRRIHYLSFPLWIIALVHGIGAGSDTGTLWAALVYIVTADAVLFLTALRLFSRKSRRPATPSPAAASSRATPAPQE